ncbi:MAG: IS630 family transposase [Planctomycetaceae bacterium]|nr:IS630 family transposase [Planctomycetaceae bacterium]
MQYWVIPPKSSGEFVARMEAVLDIYGLPYKIEAPVIVMDEQPVQLFKETRTPIAATRNHARRVDDEYERAGVANIFMLAQPLGGWRRVAVREFKTKKDWAHEVRILLEEDFPDVKKITWVCDNLNTHSIGAFYDTLEPGMARSLARRLDIVPTPKHGSWLNIAENELSALTAQCVKGRRFATIEEFREEVMAWANQCNTKQKGVDWQFTTHNARIKLRSLYPNF